MAIFPSQKVKAKTGEELILRSGRVEDAAALNELVRNVFATSAYLLTTPEEFNSTDEQQGQRIKGYIDGPFNLLLLLEHEGKLVGNLDFSQGHRRKTAHSGTIGMSIHSEWRGRGLGRILLNGLIEWMREQPILEQIRLSVLGGNDEAIALYKSVGFIEFGRNPKAIKDGDRYIPEIFMTLDLRK